MKNRYVLVKKCEIQVIISMIKFTPYSERIFNPMRSTGSALLSVLQYGLGSN